MKFLIDAMLPPQVADYLNKNGHDAVTPTQLGAHSLPDDVLVGLATAQQRVIVTENAVDFSGVTTCPVLFVRKAWWPMSGLTAALAAALERWAAANPEPGPWPHWLDAEFR